MERCRQAVLGAASLRFAWGPGVGHCWALPHARAPGILEARGAFIRLETAIDFDAVDNEPVDLIFGLLVPTEATNEHLQLLAKLAALFRDQEICTTLRSSTEETTILHTLLKEHD